MQKAAFYITISLLGLVLGGCRIATGQSYRLIVIAGDFDRLHSVVTFEWPDEFDGNRARLAAGDSLLFPAQRYDGKGWFILPALKKGNRLELTLLPQAASRPEAIVAESRDGALSFHVDNTPLLRYNFEETDPPDASIDTIYRRGGYIHPVYSPSGQTVTDDYPSNHIHHHGIWAAWTNTEFGGRSPDFWNMGAGTGTVVPVRLDTSWGGPVVAGFQSRHQYVDLTTSPPSPALNERWETNIYAIPTSSPTPYHLFDVHLSQETASEESLVLPEYRYGGLGFRGHWDWNGPENTFFLTSEGKDRSNGHATRAQWCHIGGFVDDERTGIAILGHPSNFRAPQPMRIHPTEPFFNWAPSQAGDWSIEPDETYRASYRFVVIDGPPDPQLFDRLWLDFAYPTQTILIPPGD